MMGTLAKFLAEKDIPTPEDRYAAHVECDIEDVNGVLKITRIKVQYNLKIPPGKIDNARQAFEQYLSYCPGAQSVINSIHIEHELKAEEDTGSYSG
jgi:organic hydroperoxide reductase OsmC/OhrA